MWGKANSETTGGRDWEAENGGLHRGCGRVCVCEVVNVNVK